MKTLMEIHKTGEMIFVLIWMSTICLSFTKQRQDQKIFKSLLVENIEITEINLERNTVTSSVRHKREIPAKLPDDLAFTVETQSSSLMLRLTRIKQLDTFTINSDGVTEHEEGEEMNWGVYSDESQRSTVMVERLLGRNSTINTRVRYKLTGNMELGERMIYFRPVETERDWGTDRTREETLEDNIQHVVEKSQLIIDPVHYSQKLKRRRKKRSDKSFKKYTIEICFITDAKDYEYFLDKNRGNRRLTLQEMSVYYALVSEQLRIRFHSVFETNGSIDILTKTTALYVIEDREVSNFTTGLAVNDTDIQGVAALHAAREWLLETSVPDSNVSLPSSDHYMFFTGYDMFSGTDSGNVGRAYLAQLCSEYAVSMNEDTRNGGLGTTIAHELGHGIGSGHDKDIGCKDEDNFIMATANAVPTSAEEGSHPWQFSDCTVAIFKEELDKVDCVDNDDREDNLTTSYRGGEFYDWDGQCQLRFNSNSTICIGAQFGEFPLCYLMFCKDSGQCKSMFPQEHTRCGEDMWCHKGACIPKQNVAPVITNLPEKLDLTSSSVSGDLFTVESKDEDGDEISYTYYISPPEANQLFLFDNKSGVLSVKSCTVNKTVLNNTEVTVAVAVSDDYYISYPQVLSLSLPPDFSLPVCEEPDYFLIYVLVGVLGAIILLILLGLLIFCCVRVWKRRRKRLDDSRQRLDEEDNRTEDSEADLYSRNQDVEDEKADHHITQSNVGSKHTHHLSPRGQGRALAPPSPVVNSPTIRGKVRATASKRVQNILSGASNVVQPLDERGSGGPTHNVSLNDSWDREKGSRNYEMQKSQKFDSKTKDKDSSYYENHQKFGARTEELGNRKHQTPDANTAEPSPRNADSKPARVRRMGTVIAPTEAMMNSGQEDPETLSERNQNESSTDSPELSRQDFNPNIASSKLIQRNKENKDLNSPTNSPSLSRKTDQQDRGDESGFDSPRGMKPPGRPHRQATALGVENPKGLRPPARPPAPPVDSPKGLKPPASPKGLKPPHRPPPPTVHNPRGLKPPARPPPPAVSPSRRRGQITDESFRKISLVAAQNEDAGGLWDFSNKTLDNGQSFNVDTFDNEQNFRTENLNNRQDFRTDTLHNGSDSDEDRTLDRDTSPPNSSEAAPVSGGRGLFEVEFDSRKKRKSVTGAALDVQSVFEFHSDEDDEEDDDDDKQLDLHNTSYDDGEDDQVSYDDIHNTSYDDIQNDSYCDDDDRRGDKKMESFPKDFSADDGDSAQKSKRMDSLPKNDGGQKSKRIQSFPKASGGDLPKRIKEFPRAVFSKLPSHKPFTHDAMTATPQHLHTPIPGHDITTTSYRVQLLLKDKRSRDRRK